MATLTAFDAYEIHPVREETVSGHKFCEPCAPDEASFWSLYGHVPGQGLVCIGDYQSLEDAAAIYARITGHGWGEAPVGRPEARLIEALELALRTLNEAASFPVRDPHFQTSYQVCAALGATLRDFARVPSVTPEDPNAGLAALLQDWLVYVDDPNMPLATLKRRTIEALNCDS